MRALLYSVLPLIFLAPGCGTWKSAGTSENGRRTSANKPGSMLFTNTYHSEGLPESARVSPRHNGSSTSAEKTAAAGGGATAANTSGDTAATGSGGGQEAATSTPPEYRRVRANRPNSSLFTNETIASRRRSE